MNISHALLPKLRLVALLVVVTVSAVVFGLLWTGGGGRIPVVSPDPFRTSLDVKDVNNLVLGSDVTMAGVPIGRVVAIEPDGNRARVDMEIEPDYAPLHDGVTARFREKTLAGETYIDLTDGSGDTLREGAVLPIGKVEPLVKLDDVLRTLDTPTRRSLSAALRSMGAGTQGTGESVADLLRGAGDLGREGRTALDALADQSVSLNRLAANTARVVAALDTRQGQIVQLVQDANRLTEATSASAGEIEDVMRRLPGFLASARDAGASVSKLAPALGPVARNLDASAPNLDRALRQLPATARDLRGLLPHLSRTLEKGPETLDRVPAVSDDLVALLPHAEEALLNLNPMLAYIQPYGRSMVTFFTSFGLAIARGDANGTMLRVMPVFNEQSLKNHPLSTNGLIDRNEAFPPPMGQARHPDRSPLLVDR